MPYFVYILKSITSDKSYIGHSKDLDNRVAEHNNGTSLYTRGKGPWTLIFSKQYKTRSEAVKRERYFKTVGGRIVNYWSSTPIVWRERLEFLEKYRWSSFPDYIGKKNYPSVTQREFLLNVFEGEKKYRKHVIDCLKDSSKGEWIESIQDIKLD